MGREGLHERHTHAHHTARARRPGAGVRGQREESSPNPRSPQAILIPG